jgi:rhodanese-related sulfurtransferase
LGGLVLMGGVAAFSGRWFNLGAVTDGDTLITAPEALAAVEAGHLTLVDIRRPDEWALTGIGQGATPLDMRRDDFEAALLAVVGGDRAAPLALICARGVRSRGMAMRLAQAGFSHVIDVPEGMLGSGAGPGWIKRGLPVVAPS